LLQSLIPKDGKLIENGHVMSILIDLENYDSTDTSESEPVIIDIPKKVFKPSEKAEIKINGKTDSKSYFCSLDTLKINSFFFVPENESFELGLADKSAISELGVNAYAFQNDRLVYSYQNMSITGNVLDVEIRTSKKVYEPGENVSIGVEARSITEKKPILNYLLQL
jgi:hypothetical protein